MSELSSFEAVSAVYAFVHHFTTLMAYAVVILFLGVLAATLLDTMMDSCRRVYYNRYRFKNKSIETENEDNVEEDDPVQANEQDNKDGDTETKSETASRRKRRVVWEDEKDA